MSFFFLEKGRIKSRLHFHLLKKRGKKVGAHGGGENLISLFLREKKLRVRAFLWLQGEGGEKRKSMRRKSSTRSSFSLCHKVDLLREGGRG